MMRKRIVALAVISAVVATSLFGMPLAAAVALHYLGQEATELEHTADIAALDLTADLVRTRHPGPLPVIDGPTIIGLYDAHGTLIDGHGPPRADPVVQQSLADNAIHHRSGLQTMVAAAPVPDQANGVYAVRAATPTSEIYPTIGLTWLAMLGLGVIIVAVTWQLAHWQARRLARPVEAFAASASQLADGDFTVRAPVTGIPEIDTAAVALNRAGERIADLIERERAVTAHASHQLRTPLAGLRLTLESALRTPGVDYRATAREAIAAADRLERTIDDLLTLARNRERRTGPPDIVAVLTDAAAQWRDELAKRGRGLEIVVDPQLAPPPCSTAAIRQIIAALVDNAQRHGTGTVTLHARETVDTVAIDVCDEGTSLSHRDSPFAESAANHHRIGLHLARSLAEAEGGRLMLTHTAPTTFTFFLPTERG